jgi:hypothetical protein
VLQGVRAAVARQVSSLLSDAGLREHERAIITGLRERKRAINTILSAPSSPPVRLTSSRPTQTIFVGCVVAT